jgi:single-strand selective monofunctional uracil DNA glycosylase
MGSKRRTALGQTLVDISRDLSEACAGMEFGGKVAFVYNPLHYARDTHESYLQRFARRGATLMLGMNPGPWGMSQTGVPFGEVNLVRDWLGIDGDIGRPKPEHPKRPVMGFECHRSEVSGARLWGWARDRFETPDAFFDQFFVWNYCPLAFMVESGANLTPDKLSAEERAELYAVCDRSLARVVDALGPPRVIGIGKFAQTRAQKALDDRSLPIETVLHPSPASPIANRGWAAQAEKQLATIGAL